jgi:biopolymer transport protein ExbD
MSWNIRHQGSPKSVEVPALADVVQGLHDGLWEPTDEIMGPEDDRWVPLESHPLLQETVLDLEPPLGPPKEDETRLDMTALIDVCLVLLIFFILTTSYAAIQKMLDLPALTSQEVKGVPTVTTKQVEEQMIRVEVRMEKSNVPGEEKLVPVIKVEGEQVKPENLVQVLDRYGRGARKSQVLLDASPKVPHGVTVAIQDAARGANLKGVSFLVPREELPR